MSQAVGPAGATEAASSPTVQIPGATAAIPSRPGGWLLLGLLALGCGVPAADTHQPDAVILQRPAGIDVLEFGLGAMQAWQAPGDWQDPADILRQFEERLGRYFDLGAMALLVGGREYASMNVLDRAQFQSRLRDAVFRYLADAFGLLGPGVPLMRSSGLSWDERGGLRFRVWLARPPASGGNYGWQRFDFVMHVRRQGWKVYEVRHNGVSLAPMLRRTLFPAYPDGQTQTDPAEQSAVASGPAAVASAGPGQGAAGLREPAWPGAGDVRSPPPPVSARGPIGAPASTPGVLSGREAAAGAGVAMPAYPPPSHLTPGHAGTPGPTPHPGRSGQRQGQDAAVPRFGLPPMPDLAPVPKAGWSRSAPEVATQAASPAGPGGHGSGTPQYRPLESTPLGGHPVEAPRPAYRPEYPRETGGAQ